MRVLSHYNLQEPVHFLRLRQRAKGDLSMTSLPTVLPESFRFVICQHFYIWFPCGATALDKPVHLEKAIMKQARKPVFTGGGCQDRTGTRITFPELTAEELVWLQALIYRAFGHDHQTLHPPAPLIRNLNPKVYSGKERIGTYQEIFNAIQAGEQYDLLF